MMAMTICLPAPSPGRILLLGDDGGDGEDDEKLFSILGNGDQNTGGI